MKAICLIGMCVVVFGCISCQSTVTHLQDKHMTVRTTAYTHSESDHIKYGRKTAINTVLKAETQYTSAASDWSFLPVGTIFTIKGDKHRYVIDDYGSALVGTHTIDIYRPSRSSMNSWGVKVVDISIECVGDYYKSLAILQDRAKFEHVRQMLQGIKQKYETIAMERAFLGKSSSSTKLLPTVWRDLSGQLRSVNRVDTISQ